MVPSDDRPDVRESCTGLPLLIRVALLIAMLAPCLLLCGMVVVIHAYLAS